MLALLALLSLSPAALADEPATTTTAAASEPRNLSWRGLALDGYDPVAYFVSGAPTKGSEDITTSWGGGTWRFSSAENRALFVADPAKYAPQYGGYCAWAVSEGYTADIDPAAWKIVDGKLYLNYSLKVQAQWEQDVPGRIKKADANWPKVAQ
ncbi:MAG: YHS domain protein [Alphaproteobacteria bacterium]|nr:YHS domain protein [Alphaproteobacteria bacterium]